MILYQSVHKDTRSLNRNCQLMCCLPPKKQQNILPSKTGINVKLKGYQTNFYFLEKQNFHIYRKMHDVLKNACISHGLVQLKVIKLSYHLKGGQPVTTCYQRWPWSVSRQCWEPCPSLSQGAFIHSRCRSYFELNLIFIIGSLTKMGIK